MACVCTWVGTLIIFSGSTPRAKLNLHYNLSPQSHTRQLSSDEHNCIKFFYDGASRGMEIQVPLGLAMCSRHLQVRPLRKVRNIKSQNTAKLKALSLGIQEAKEIGICRKSSGTPNSLLTGCSWQTKELNSSQNNGVYRVADARLYGDLPRVPRRFNVWALGGPPGKRGSRPGNTRIETTA